MANSDYAAIGIWNRPRQFSPSVVIKGRHEWAAAAVE